jgi:hypothetical protein
MKVLYNGTTATEHLKSGAVLRPGENDVPDDVAAEMLAAGLVKRPGPVAPSLLVTAAPDPDSGVATPRRRGRTDERTEERG